MKLETDIDPEGYIPLVGLCGLGSFQITTSVLRGTFVEDATYLFWEVPQQIWQKWFIELLWPIGCFLLFYVIPVVALWSLCVSFIVSNSPGDDETSASITLVTILTFIGMLFGIFPSVR